MWTPHRSGLTKRGPYPLSLLPVDGGAMGLTHLSRADWQDSFLAFGPSYSPNAYVYACRVDGRESVEL